MNKDKLLIKLQDNLNNIDGRPILLDNKILDNIEYIYYYKIGYLNCLKDINNIIKEQRKIMNIELSKEEILRIQDWFGYSESEGHIEDKDWEIYKKLKDCLK